MADPSWDEICPATRGSGPCTCGRILAWPSLAGPVSDRLPGRDDGASVSLVLIWRDERGAEICRSTPLALGAAKVAIPLDAQSVGLIGEQT